MLEADHQLQQGRYRIKEPLGRGGMGTVYLATDRNLSDRLVAIKENGDSTPEIQQQFQHEAAVLARLTHPNLPRVTDYFIEPSGFQYLVMDYVIGEDLRQLAQRKGGPLPEADVLRWTSKVMDALEYMHGWVNPETGISSPIVHRDIKPGNIKVAPNGQVVLVDFGLAKYLSSEVTQVGARGATPGYSPPEQYTGGTDPRSDIYSLGATMYMLLTGQRPIDAIQRVNGETLTPPSQLNPTLTPNCERVILRAMQNRANERYQSVQQMRAALLGAAVDDSEVTVVPNRGVRRSAKEDATPPPSIFRRSMLWAGLLLLLIIVILALLADLPQQLSSGWLALQGNSQATPASTDLDPNSLTGDASGSDTPTVQATPTQTSTVQLAASAPISTETSTPTATETATFVPTATDTATHVPTVTPTVPLTPTFAPSPTATASPTVLPTATAVTTATSAVQIAAISTATVLSTATSTATLSPTATFTATPLPTSTATHTATNTSTPLPPTATATATQTATPQPTVTNTATLSPTVTFTATPLPTSTATHTATNTSTPKPPTATPQPTVTFTATALPTSTATATPQPTATSTATRSPTVTNTATSKPTATATPSSTPTATPQPTATDSPTALPTDTPVPTATASATTQPTATDTATLLPTSTSTPRPTATNTVTATPTATALPTAIVEATTVPTARAGEVRIHAGDKARYRYVPAGKFSMGSNDRNDNAQPVHIVYLDGYWIKETEVTNAEYLRCVQAGKCEDLSDNPTLHDPAYATHPVVEIKWEQAAAYAAAIGGRLPTEAEWEKAARGPSAFVYPWGNTPPDTQHANFSGAGTQPAGSYPVGASPYGLLDMAGNVKEWVGDWYALNYYKDSPLRNPTGPSTGRERVLRGGFYGSNAAQIRSARRDKGLLSAFPTVGFRVVLEEPQ